MLEIRENLNFFKCINGGYVVSLNVYIKDLKGFCFLSLHVYAGRTSRVLITLILKFVLRKIKSLRGHHKKK